LDKSGYHFAFTGDWMAKGTKVLSRDRRSTGTLTGRSFPCRMEGCTGLRLATRWGPRETTYPCTKGMTYDHKAGTWRIE
jgi:hypothetical protein